MNRGEGGALFGSAGLEIDGGIACVSRCIARALDEVVTARKLSRADRVLLLDKPESPPAPPAAGEQQFARGKQWRFVWQLWRSYRSTAPQVVLFDQVGLARAARLRLPGYPPRYAIFCHGLELDRSDAASQRAFSGAWRLLANSERTGEVLRDKFPEAASRVRVVPLCIDPARIEAWEDRPPGVVDATREPAALIVGRMWSEQRGKGHDALIEAWPSVRRREPRAELWIVGQGDDVPRLKELARYLEVGRAVKFLGRISDTELSERYHRASVMAMPSRQEGFGLVYAEAMWHGLACIGSTMDAASEVIRNDVTGLLVPYADPGTLANAVVAVLQDPDRRRRMGEAGYREARERFAYERFAKDLIRNLEIV